MAEEPEINDTVHTPTDKAREEARRNPGGWVYKIEGDYGPEDAVPREAVVGAWKVDDYGNITGNFIPNPNYHRPKSSESTP
jgi:hypothetical protein